MHTQRQGRSASRTHTRSSPATTTPTMGLLVEWLVGFMNQLIYQIFPKAPERSSMDFSWIADPEFPWWDVALMCAALTTVILVLTYA